MIYFYGVGHRYIYLLNQLLEYSTMTESSYVKTFGPAANDPLITQKCDKLCSLFGLSSQDLFSNWEAFTYTELKDTKTKISLENLELLQKYIQRTITEKNKLDAMDSLKLNTKHSLQSKTSANTSFNHDADTSIIKKRKLNIPSSPNSYASESANTSTVVKSNQIVESLNTNNIQDKQTTILNKNIKILADFKKEKYKYRTMNLKLLDIADYLDERIEIFTEIVAKHYDIDESKFGDPTRQSQSEIYTVGRIVPDSPLNSGSTDLNLQSLFLETSRVSGFGIRIPVDLSNVTNFSFFPGQIVAFRGINAAGDCFKVLDNLKLHYLGASTHSFEDIEAFSNILGDDNLKVLVTAGPYHSKHSLNFSRLENFIKHANEEIKPDVIIMNGPLIDINCIPNILNKSFLKSDDDLDDLKNLDDIFRSYLAPILNEIQCSKVILLPHGSDIVNPHTPYPQAAFNRKTLGLNKQFKCFPNPSLFSLNEVSFGASNADILRDMKDVPTNNTNTNRIERIVEHLLYQRHFYPISPTPNPNFQVDTSFLGLAELDTSIPDVFIIPSVLKPFAKFIKNVLVINPGSFIRPDGNGGTYVLLQVKTPDFENLDTVMNPTNEDDDEEEVTQNYLTTLSKRSRVDVINV